MKIFVVVSFQDGSERKHVCESKGQAKRKLAQALPIAIRLGASVRVVDANGKEVVV